MQKIRIFFSLFLTIVLTFSLISPLGYSFAWQEHYDYREFYDKINVSSGATVLEKTFFFDSPRTTFSLVVDGLTQASAEDILVEWDIGGKIFSRHLDIEDDTDFSRVTTFPLVSSARSDISVKIYFSRDFDPSVDFSLMSSLQDSTSRSLIFHPGSFITYADTDTRIVSRAEWGADETLRYISQERLSKKREEWIARGQTPRIIEETHAEYDRRIKTEREFNAIFASNPDATTTITLKRYENGNKLFWPIEKTKKVDRIMIHHTAESLEQDNDDATLVRAIYLYHTRTKGWGDIGYNFIIGQRGKIYEGRAGGDYVQGAHVYGNNRGTVGISLIGNYDKYTVNRDQKAGLLEAIIYVSKKYGIRPDESSVGASLCSGSSDCIWRSVDTPRLMAHRDLSATSCPGKHLYSLLPELRNTVVGNVGNIKPILNNIQGIIEKSSPEDAIEYRIKSNTPAFVAPPQALLKSSGGKSIKIRLSYPNNDMIDLKPAGIKNPIILLDGKRVLLRKGEILSVGKVGNNKILVKNGQKSYSGSVVSFQSDIVEIASWSRVPSWDRVRQYNDNVFRSKIIVRNIDSKLLVVNELPIEDYLKGLGEVSNGDLGEKIKTIIVGARSYAYHYIDSKNRKYSTTLYDGSDNPDEFQKYLGYSYEQRSPNVVKMVDATRGQVITYGGKLIKSWYFSSSDGKTRSYLEYCQSNGGKSCADIPYLQSVDDPAGVGHVRAGHGVGISGIGATYAASMGKSYKDIIAYYLKGVKIESIKNLK